jgi:tetratricopeptide (TPR) repeat protein
MKPVSRVMTVDNPKLKICDVFFTPILTAKSASRVTLSVLLMVAPLFFPVDILVAQELTEKSARALEPTVSSEQNQLDDDASKTDLKSEPSVAIRAASESVIFEQQDTLANYDVTEGAAPLDIPLINVNPLITVSPELRASLKRQFQQIQILKETEDAFSERLGESYRAYGRSLTQAGRTEEARAMLVNALHIIKVNDGVNSIEQRPILRELFEMNLALGNTEEMTAQVDRIIWLENRHSKEQDSYSFDMVARLGNYYLDLYLKKPVSTELNLNHLNKATRYFGGAVNRYGDLPLSEVLLPFGELALAHHYRSKIQNEIASATFPGVPRTNFANTNSLNGRRLQIDSFSNSERILKSYLRKAKNERDLINTIYALLGLGDLHLLTGRTSKADKYFDLAWAGAQNLPATHSIIESFNNPVKLPSFHFSVVRRPPVSRRETELIVLSINVDNDGRVRSVETDALVDVDKWVVTKAKRMVKRYKFRPVIDNGKLVESKGYRYELQIASRKSKALAPKAVVSKDGTSKQ